MSDPTRIDLATIIMNQTIEIEALNSKLIDYKFWCKEAGDECRDLDDQLTEKNKELTQVLVTLDASQESLSIVTKEIERLKAALQTANIIAEHTTDEADTLRSKLAESSARLEQRDKYVEELEAQLKETVNAGRNLRDELKTKIQSLESLGYEDIYVAIEKERDDLRTQLDAANEKLAVTMDELDSWQRYGGPLQPPADLSKSCPNTAPTIVKQTWQAIYSKGLGAELEEANEELRTHLNTAQQGHTKIALLYQARGVEIDELRTQLEGESAALKVTQKLLMEARTRLAEQGQKLAATTDLCDLRGVLLEEKTNQLAALQPPAPTIVKQTWQNVYQTTDMFDVGCNADWPQIERRYADHNRGAKCMAVLRRDHYSDGTVKATLEQIGETK